MGALAAYVPIVHTEADGLARFLETLSADDWRRPSACDLWAIRDVVAHLIWAADFYTDTVSRGLQSDSAQPADRPPGDAPEPAAMPTYFHQQMRTMRDRVGTQLVPTFRSSFQALFTLLSGLSPQQWDMPCAFYRRTQPAHAFLLLIIQELVIHGWDKRPPQGGWEAAPNAGGEPRLEAGAQAGRRRLTASIWLLSGATQNRQLYDTILIPPSVLAEVAEGQFVTPQTYVQHYGIGDLIEVRAVAQSERLPEVARLHGERS